MRKIKGFKLGKRLIRVSNWFLRRTRIRKLLNWGRRLKNGAKAICSVRPGSGYQQLGESPIGEQEPEVPKGYLAVYVGIKEGGFNRVLVPVIYFNHPLFSDLLRESEEEYGFEHDGGITIPCRYSEFEKVQARIAAGRGGRRRNEWHRCRSC